MQEDLTKLPAEQLLTRFMSAQHQVSTLVLAQSLVGEEYVDKARLAERRQIQNAFYEELKRRLALVPLGS